MVRSGDLFPEQMNTIKSFQVTINDHVDFLSRLKSSRLHSDGDIKGLHPGREEWAYGTSTSFCKKLNLETRSTVAEQQVILARATSNLNRQPGPIGDGGGQFKLGWGGQTIPGCLEWNATATTCKLRWKVNRFVVGRKG